MSTTNKTIALLMVTLVLASLAAPLMFATGPQIEVTTTETSMTLSDTDLSVTNETFNEGDFDDDDFLFTIRNYSLPVALVNVSLYNATDDTKYDSKVTIGDGTAAFYDLPQGTYKWNVTWSEAPGEVVSGFITSDGPEAFVTTKIGNLDWENDDDDLNVTVVDVGGNPAEGLNFSIHFRDNNTIWEQVILNETGVHYFTDIPIENYTWKVTVVSNDYAGTVLDAQNFTTDGTTIKVHQTIGPFAGLEEYYDLEVFVYYETTLEPLSGADIVVMYKNATVIDSETTPTNGTVRFLDLPVAFINWTVKYNGEFVGLGNYSYNLTTSSSDAQSPVIISPGDQSFIYGTNNITMTWHLEDNYPDEIEVLIDDVTNTTMSWTETSYDFVFNVTGTPIGVYEVKLIATDKNGNTASDTIELDIYESVLPEIDGPDDLEFYFSESGYSLRWNVTDDHVDSYEIKRDGVGVNNGTLDPDQPFVTLNLDHLSIGTYEYEFMANDTSGNQAFDNVTVTVKADDVDPVITYSPETVVYPRGAGNMVRNWTAVDDYKDNYTITVDGEIIVQSDWESETIEFDFAGLSEGHHSVVLTVYDVGGNSATSTVTVTVTLPVQYLIILWISALIGIVFVVGLVVWFTRYR